MSNVLSEEKKQQVIALGRLGWSTRRIERETGIRRETISTYLREAGIGLRPARGRVLSKPASGSGPVTPVRIPGDADQRSEPMSIIVPKGCRSVLRL